MNIALDMMGGDFAPLEALKGVQLFFSQPQQHVSLILIGDEQKINPLLSEYKIATETLQKNKEGKPVILYTTNPIQQDAYVQEAVAKGYIVVKMETLVDAAFINNMEMKAASTKIGRAHV